MPIHDPTQPAGMSPGPIGESDKSFQAGEKSAGRLDGRTYTKLSPFERLGQLAKVVSTVFLGALSLGTLFISSTVRANLQTWWVEFKTSMRKPEAYDIKTASAPPAAQNADKVRQSVLASPLQKEAAPLAPSESQAPRHIEPNAPSNGSPKLSSALAAAKALGPLTAANFSQHAQLVLDQFYKKAMPNREDVTVPNLKGEMVLWKDLSPREQQEILTANKKGATSSLFLHYEGPEYCEKIIPRWSHGCRHVTGAAMAINLIVQMYKKYDPTFKLTEEDILMAQYLAIFHDSARQAEGVDVWDHQSAENARSFLLAMGYKEVKVNRAIADLQSKDHPDPAARSPVARLVHDADCLEIMRIYGKYGFKNKYLDMFNDLKDKPGFLKEFEELKTELYDSIQFMEHPLLKTNLETQSIDYYRDVVGLAGSKKGGKPRFPLIAQLLRQQIGELPKASHQAQWMADPEQIPTSGQLAIVRNLVSTGQSGVNKSYMVADETGKLFFWKAGDKFTLPSETSASQMAHYITGGLVPIAEKKSFQPDSKSAPLEGTLQPYVELKKGAFAPKNYAAGNFDPAKLTPKQREQFFAHMIADRLISNYDTHTGQFRIDQQGNVVGYDKGQAFRFFGDRAVKEFYKSEPRTFDPNFYWKPLGLNRPTYSVFAQYLRNNPAEVKRIWQSTTVQSAIKRCKALSNEQIRGWLQPYADVAFAGTQKNFIDSVHQRTQNIEGDLKKYFGL